MKKIDFTYDSAFKYLFKSDQTKFFLYAVVAELLDKLPSDIVKSLVIEDSELISFVYRESEKGKITDVLVTNNDKTLNIEMNRSFYEGIVENKLRYPQHIFNNNFLKGKNDVVINTIMQVHVNDFSNMNKEAIDVYCYQSGESILTDKIVIMSISLEKIKEKWDNKITLSQLEKYMLYIKFTNLESEEKIKTEEMKRLIEGDEILMQIEKIREEMSLSESLEAAFDYDREQEIERTLMRNYAMKQGREQGLEQGLLQTAKKMIDAKESIEKIKEYTGLSKKQIKSLM